MKNSQLIGIVCLFIFMNILRLPAQTPADIPWEFHPVCNSILNTGITAVTCGVSQDAAADERYTFGLIDLNGVLPNIGRIEVMPDMYHHPAWTIDSIGNVFGLAIDDCGNTYVAASANYASEFFFTASVIRYGDIGGGANDVAAAGTVYKIDLLTGQPTVFAVLPQQLSAMTHQSCEGALTFDRIAGPGLGNIVFHEGTQQFYVSNFEDGRIYRLANDGAIIDSYDAFNLDDAAAGAADLEEVVYGLAIHPENSELYFGTVYSEPFVGTGNDAEIYSIPLNADGSFTGSIDNSTNPVGATWDNYIGEETLHHTFIPQTQFGMYYLSDLTFTPSGDLLVGARKGCSETLFSSYNHFGHAFVLEEDGGLFNTVQGVIHTGGETIFGNGLEGYGGVATFDNPAGGIEYVLSSSDMISDAGPHGICTQPAGVFGTPFAPASPAGLISYGEIASTLDPKGIGGDVEVFKACFCQVVCADSIIATAPEMVCSGETFNLSFSLLNGNSDFDAVWTDMDGNSINPEDISLENIDCAPASFTFTVTATCLEDPEVVLVDEVEVIVLTNQIEDFFTIIEAPCSVTIEIDPACAEYISIDGDLPEIMAGDTGMVSVDVVLTANPECAMETVDLNYACPDCQFLDANATVLACSGEEFEVELDVEVELGGEVFTVTNEDGEIIGTFNYSDVPVTIGPFFGDSLTIYSLTLTDLTTDNCLTTVDFGPVDCLEQCGTWEMPNAFSPNGDDINETYYYKGKGPIEVLEFRIYNRWGQLLYDETTPWDGFFNNTPSPSDVFVYIIRVDTQCGIEEMHGDVTLLR